MKKIFAFILCVLLICATPLIAFAEEGETPTTETEVVEGENSTTTEETVTEDEIQPPAETPPVDETPAPDETPEETTPTFEEEVEMVTAQIGAWLEENSGFIGMIITLVGYGIVGFRKLTILIKSAGTMNNNAITISNNSKEAISNATAAMENAASIVLAYEAKMTALLEAYKNTAEEKAMLEKALVEIKNYLATSSKSNLAFADEFAELLALANIPNYKKDELGKIFVAAKNEIIDAEAKAEIEADNAAKLLLPAATEEVMANVGEEA